MAEYPGVPRVGVLAIVWRSGRVLLVQRRNPPDAGLWGFPGGKQDLGETVTEAAERELFEETAVAAAATEPLTVLDAITRDGEGGVRFHYTLIAVLARWRAGDGEVGSDAQDLRWVTPAEAALLPRSRAVDRLIALSQERLGLTR